MALEVGPEAKSSRQKTLPAEFKIAFVIFLLASGFVFSLLPQMFANHSAQPPFALYLCAGLLAVIFTSFLLWYVSRLGLGFNRNALVLSFGYGVVIALIKLVVSPFALYTANNQAEFQVDFFSPNEPTYYVTSAAVILFLYLMVFTVMYKIALKRVKAEIGTNITSSKRKRGRYITLAIGVIAVLLYGTGYYVFPLIMAGSALNYLGYIFNTFSILLVFALLLAIFFAHKSFEVVEKQVINTKNTTLLASFFWVGVSLIFLYHVMWVVFMLALVQLWPFRTYTPK